MSTVLLDFDSTLISCESLEQIIKFKNFNRSQIIEEIEKITQMGMNGRISFSESFHLRLKLAQPLKSEVLQFAEHAFQYLTPGMATLIERLHRQEVNVHIVSGGLKEAIIKIADKLNISSENVHAVQLMWDSKGRFKGIDPNDKFSQSKADGVKSIASQFSKPRISIGDGKTDLTLYEEGLVDHFILFTQNILRKQLVDKSPYVASSVDELTKLLEPLL